MKADHDMRAAVLALLRDDAALGARINRVHDGMPAKATPPMLVVGECGGTDWGCKDRPGREVRITLTVEDDIETTTRIGGILTLTDEVVQRLSGTVAGWSIASLRLVRSRLLRTNAGRWNGLMEYRIRVLAAE